MSSPPKLDAAVLKSILVLNHFIPEENMKYWITVDEMRDRLIQCGVDRALSSDMIIQALNQVNRGGSLMTKRPDGKTSYYRPSCYLFEAGAPLDQRKILQGSKRLPNILNKQIEEYEEQGNEFTVEDLSRFSLQHEGQCFRKSNYSSAGAEEYEGAKAGQGLLMNSQGEIRDASTCVFVDQLIADNDTSGPNNFIARQHAILGSVVDNKAEHFPDIGHTVKNSSNEMYKLRDKDTSFRGKNCLSNTRIKSISSDITKAVKDYNPYVGDEVKRKECLDQLRTIIRHHCNDHSLCKQEKFCSHLKVQNEHPTWSKKEIEAEAIKRSKRHKTHMDLSSEGIYVLEKIINKRFNEKTIDKIAKLGSSNHCEGFWSELVKLSEGKRLGGCGTDLWFSMLQLCYCMNGQGHKEQSREELSKLLGLFVTDTENKAHALSAKIREKNKVRHGSEKGKMRRQRSKMTAAHRQQKDAKSRKKHHKSDKVPLTKSSKMQAKYCKKCGQTGHNTRSCVVLPDTKQRFTPFVWDGILGSTPYMPRKKKYKPQDYKWSMSNFAT